MTSVQPQPPRWTRRLLRRWLPSEVREFVVGDLDEEFTAFVVPTRGSRRAARWYRAQALRSLWHVRTRHPRRRPATESQREEAPMGQWIQDMRYALRTLRGSPAFTAVTLATLALGAGASTAILSTVNQAILRPLPVHDPERLVMLWEANEERGWDRVHAAPANIGDWRERVTAFDDVAYYSEYARTAALTGFGEARLIRLGQASGNLFSVLGVPPLHGRVLREEDEREGAPPPVLLGYGTWQRVFGGDAAVVGRTIPLDGIPSEVVGVLPASFGDELTDVDAWTTFGWTAARRASVWFRQAHVVRPIARLAPGTDIDAARAELSAVAHQLQQEHPELNRGMEAGMSRLQPFLSGDRRGPLLILLGAVLVLQWIACVNVANLLLVRSIGRRREMAVRRALGAGRWQVMRQVLTESSLLAVGGGVLGLGVAMLGLRFMQRLAPPELPISGLRLDPRMLAFAAALVVVSTLLFGAVPALRSAGVRLTAVLGDGSRTSSPGRGGLTAARTMVALEIALAVVLVMGAGLLVRSLVELKRLDPGVDPHNVLTFRITPPAGGYPDDPARVALLERVIDRLEAIPGVTRAAAVRNVPYTGMGWSSDFTVEGWGPEHFGLELRHNEATPGYFAALGIPLRDGRIYERAIAPGAPLPVVVNQAFADRYFPEESPVGRRIAFDRSASVFRYEITGVVGNERRDLLREPAPEVIAHLAADMPGNPMLTVKTAVPPESLVTQVRAALTEIDPNIPLADVRTMEQVASDALASERFLLTLFSVFGATAFVLAGIGVYGVSAQAARARVHEIGIRMALGASAGRILRLLVARGAGFVAAGLGVGVVGALAGGRLVESLLFGVSPTDPATLVVVAIALGGLALGSGLVPALRAARTNPAQVLRGE